MGEPPPVPPLGVWLIGIRSGCAPCVRSSTDDAGVGVAAGAGVGVGVGVGVNTVAGDGADTTKTPWGLLVTAIISSTDADRPSTRSIAVIVPSKSSVFPPPPGTVSGEAAAVSPPTLEVSTPAALMEVPGGKLPVKPYVSDRPIGLVKVSLGIVQVKVVPPSHPTVIAPEPV